MRSLSIVALALLFIASPVKGAAQATSLACEITLWQTKKSELAGISAAPIRPRTEAGKRLTSFILNLAKVGGEAWLHQNVCVDRCDFRGGRFAGTLCALVMTARESAEDSSSSALIVDISRLEQGLAPTIRKPASLDGESLGGFRVEIPIDPAGSTISLSQILPQAKGRPDLFKIEIACRR